MRSKSRGLSVLTVVSLSFVLVAVGCQPGESGALQCFNDGDCPPACSCDIDLMSGLGDCESDETTNKCGGTCDRESGCPTGTECLLDRTENDVEFYQCRATNGGTGGTAGAGGMGGGDLCAGVDCDDGNECTAAEACDPADGQCTRTFVDDGTPCDDDQGVCMDGECILGTLDGCGSASLRYQDGDFAPGSWASIKIEGSSEGTSSIASITTEPSGGNPGAYHQVVISLTATEDQLALIWVAHALDGALYDPGTEGEICGVRVFLDGADQFDPIVGHKAIFSVFMLQDGTYYWGNRLTVSSDMWERGAWTTDDFVKFDGEGPDVPDLSASGAPIQFGYLTGNSRPTSAPGMGMPVSAADNFNVELFPPAP